jgi:3-oxoacyl-[acyl-carrier protein] reductase
LEEDDVLLENKSAVIYGGGPIGAAVAHAFAREGAKVFLAGRTVATLDKVAEEISATGSMVETAQVNALEENAVEEHAASVSAKAGGIDVAFNAVGYGDIHGQPLSQMSFQDFVAPITDALRAQFLITRAAARHMVRQGSGAILTITATTARPPIPLVGGTGVRFDAMEGLCRQWAAELGPHGVRVAWLRTTGLPEALRGERFPGYGTGSPEMTRDQLIAWMQGKTMLGRLTSLVDIANAAAFIASKHGGALTAGALNLSCGSVPDY